MEDTKTKKHYLGLFTVNSWREFLANGGGVMGFNEKKRTAVAKLSAGDIILCYLSKVSAFVGILEVTGQVYCDSTPIWTDGIFSTRLPVKTLTARGLSNALPIRHLAGKLTFLPKPELNAGWSIYVRSSPLLWKQSDAHTVMRCLTDDHSVAIENADAATSSIKHDKKKNFSEKSRVGRLIKRSNEIISENELVPIGSYESALSGNKVTGFSVNVPISLTCRPTAVCLSTCYFATKAPSWASALKHQGKVYASLKQNPVLFAERIALEYDSKGLTFLRWNGGGDLFPESVDAINHIGKVRPDIVIWVVTRIPELAAQIGNFANVFIHFSLDKNSLSRKDKFLSCRPLSKNFFFSYQCLPDEMPDPSALGGSSVLFFDNYKPTGSLEAYQPEIICPLNESADIRGVCIDCRRCFDGTAVDFEKN